MPDKSLTTFQQRVYDFLSKDAKGKAITGTDLPILDVYAVAYAMPRAAVRMAARQAQMSLGSVISRINKKLKKERIEPGKLKQTYRLTVID